MSNVPASTTSKKLRKSSLGSPRNIRAGYNHRRYQGNQKHNTLTQEDLKPWKCWVGIDEISFQPDTLVTEVEEKTRKRERLIWNK
jgi:hypothetical protein